MLTWDILLTFLAGVLLIHATPPPAAQQDILSLTPAQINEFRPYSFYASAAYCESSKTRTWTCGSNCESNPDFKPIASGGDGALVQYWYVGYDPTLQTVIVAYQGTSPKKVIPFFTNAILRLDKLDKSLFLEISSFMKIHDGFGEAQERSAKAVLTAVKTALNEYSTKKVTLVGHSLGGAIALVSSVYLKLHLPAGTIVNTVAYSMPRVGNQAFADYVDANLNLTRINNKRDPIPITPGRFLGFRHPKGERYIQSSDLWVVCPGQDDSRKQCIRGSVSDVFAGDIKDHNGPFDGVIIDC